MEITSSSVGRSGIGCPESAAFTSRKIHGFPFAPLATIIPSQPVYSRILTASSPVKISPLPITGIETAEYDAAKDEQRSMEARIEELEKIIKNAEVIDESAYDKDTVSIGSTIKFYDEEFDEELEYRIVGSTESDILKGLISNESPLGKALIGAKVGETVQVESPDGFSRYKILEISRS